MRGLPAVPPPLRARAALYYNISSTVNLLYHIALPRGHPSVRCLSSSCWFTPPVCSEIYRLLRAVTVTWHGWLTSAARTPPTPKNTLESKINSLNHSMKQAVLMRTFESSLLFVTADNVFFVLSDLDTLASHLQNISHPALLSYT